MNALKQRTATLLLAAAALLAALAVTIGHPATVAASSTYTLRSDGFYWKGGDAYIRYVSGYDCYGKPTYKYQKVVTPASKDWRAKLLEMERQNDRDAARLDYSANEQNEFVETYNLMQSKRKYFPGSVGRATIDRSHPYAIFGGLPAGYGASPLDYGLSQRTAPQGSTSFAWQQSDIADIYGNVDLGALYNASIRLASDLNGYGSTATAGTMALVDKLGDRSASLMSQRIALNEIAVKGQAMSQVAGALSEAIKAESRAYVVRNGGGGGGGVNGAGGVAGGVADGAAHALAELPANIQAKLANGTLDNVGQVVQFRCANCHRPGGKAAHFDMTNLDKIDARAGEKILLRITRNDPGKPQMPPDKPLSAHELSLFFLAAGTPAEVNASPAAAKVGK